MDLFKRAGCTLAIFFVSLTLIACAGDAPPPFQGECRTNADCTDGVCDLATNTCQRTVPPNQPGSNAPPAADVGLTSEQDTGMPQLDTGTPGNDTDTPGPGVIADVGEDVLPDIQDESDEDLSSFFSGCMADANCAGYQTCNVALGRCEDTRSECDAPTDCAGTEVCLAGICTTATCHPTNSPCAQGLDCILIDEDQGIGYCTTICTDFDAPTVQCAPDTQCFPALGRDFGFCRGVGSRDTGETCTSDFGTGSCQSGKACISVDGESTCRDFCSAEGTRTCGQDAFCLPTFEGFEEDGSDDAGVCFHNCGGILDRDDTSCAADEGCYPISSAEGFCRLNGTVAAGGICRFDGTNRCQGGSYCNATGPEATQGATTQGVCMGLCDPAQGGCGASQSCFADRNDPGFGVCALACNPLLPAEQNGCPVGRERCWATAQDATPASQGFCRAGGDIATGGACILGQPLACNADAICVNAGELLGGAVQTGQEPGTCARYCLPYDYGNASRCPTGQACAPRFITNGVGFCSSLVSSTGTNPGDSCASDSVANSGTWCSDNTLCLPWRAPGVLTCERLCYTDEVNVCPQGQTCKGLDPTDPDFTVGYCE